MRKFIRDLSFPVFMIVGTFLSNFQMKRFPRATFDLAVGTIFFTLLLLVAGGALVELHQRRVKGERVLRLKDPFWALAGLVAVLLFTLAIVGYLFSVADVARATYGWLSDPSVNRSEASLVVAVLVMATGLVLFWFRLVARACYGAVEVLVGIYVAASQVQQVAPGVPVTQTSVLLALLTAGVYLVVRGLDNIHQGCKADKPDRIALFFIRKLTRSKAATHAASVERPK
jgi:hypothetical protein